MDNCNCFPCRSDPGVGRVRSAGVLAGLLQRPPTPSPPDRVPTAGQRPRGPTPAPSEPTCSIAATEMWDLALQLQQADGEVLYSHRRLSTRPSLPSLEPWNSIRMGYSRPGAPSIFPLDQGAGLARPVVLLRTPAAPGQGRRAEPVSGIGSDHCRVDRRCPSPNAAWRRSCRMRLRILTPSTNSARCPSAVGSILVAAVDGKGIPMVKPAAHNPQHG